MNLLTKALIGTIAVMLLAIGVGIAAVGLPETPAKPVDHWAANKAYGACIGHLRWQGHDVAASTSREAVRLDNGRIGMTLVDKVGEPQTCEVSTNVYTGEYVVMASSPIAR